MGRAGVMDQLIGSMKMEYVIIMHNREKYMHIMPGKSFAGPVTQQLQKKRLFPGQASISFGIII
jgi:hypothetical protein